jgi:hypothetical protein
LPLSPIMTMSPARSGGVRKTSQLCKALRRARPRAIGYCLDRRRRRGCGARCRGQCCVGVDQPRLRRKTACRYWRRDGKVRPQCRCITKSGGIRQSPPRPGANVATSSGDAGGQSSEREADIGRARAELTRCTCDADPQIDGPLPEFACDPAGFRTGLDRHPMVAMIVARTRHVRH